MIYLRQAQQYTALICYFIILTFCFVFNSSQSFFISFHPKWVSELSYFLIFGLFLALTVPLKISDFKKAIDFKKEHSFLVIMGIASLILLYSLLLKRTEIQYTLMYLVLFLSSRFIVKNLNLFMHLTGISFSICAIYSALGMFCSIFKFSYGFIPILPSTYDHLGNFIGYGFMNNFSYSLYIQTNAAGAIFGYAICLFYLFYVKTKNRQFITYMAFASLGLVLTKALAPLVITAALLFITSSISFRRKCLFSLLSLLIATPLFAQALAHKINTSFLIKLRLLKENLLLIFFENRQLIFIPKISNFQSTENSFIDLCFQYGFALSSLFYIASFILITKFIKFKRINMLVLFPFFLSFFQNSTFSPPVMLSFTLGCLFLIYFKNTNTIPLTTTSN